MAALKSSLPPCFPGPPADLLSHCSPSSEGVFSSAIHVYIHNPPPHLPLVGHVLIRRALAMLRLIGIITTMMRVKEEVEGSG